MAQVTLNKKSLDRLLKKLDDVQNPTDKATSDKIGSTIVREMKADISDLKSPIRGKGTFPALQQPYKSRKASLGKGDKPNLDLTGQFLKSLTHKSNRVRDGYSTTILFSNQTARLKEKGHRDGANGQRERPIIPSPEEGFNRRITNAVIEIYEDRLKAIVKK